MEYADTGTTRTQYTVNQSLLFLESNPGPSRDNYTESLILDSDDILQRFNAHEVHQMLPVIIFYTVILTIGLFGNALVLLVYIFRYKRSQARMFILFLATNDFLMCLFGLPYQIMDMTHPYTYTYSALCKVSSFVIVSLFYVSVFGLVVIAFDRYIKICHPLGTLHTQYFGKKRACVIAVLFGLLLSWPILFLYGPSEMDTGQYNITGHACYYLSREPEIDYVIIHSLTTLCFCVGSTVCLIVLYSLVFYQIYTRYRGGNSLRSLQQHTAEDSSAWASEGVNKLAQSPCLSSPGFVKNGQGNNGAAHSEDASDTEEDWNKAPGHEIGNQKTFQRYKTCNVKDVSGSTESDSGKCCLTPLGGDSCTGTVLCMEALTHVTELQNRTKLSDETTELANEGTSLLRNQQNNTKTNTNETAERANEGTSLLRNQQNNTKTNKIDGSGELPRNQQENQDQHQPGGLSLQMAVRRKEDVLEKYKTNDEGNILHDNSAEYVVNDPDIVNILYQVPDIQARSPAGTLCQDKILRTKSIPKMDTLKENQNTHVSLRINSLHASKSSVNSVKSFSSVFRKSPAFGDDGLRINGSTRNLGNSENCLNHHSKNVSDKSPACGHSKITKIMVTITTVFILSYTPTLVVILWTNIQPYVWDTISIHQTLVFEFCLRFYLVNNICNPFIYGFWDKRFKREVVFTLRKLAGTTCQTSRH